MSNAIAIADRVAKERSKSLGSTVGYHIRLEQKTSPQTVLTYCTTGVLLRTLAGDGLAGDVSHLNLDEVHERQQNTDYLLIAVRQILEHHSDLKVILMSATMDGNRETFTSYFAKFDVGHVHIPSRLHNVDTFHLSQVLAMTRYIPKEEEGRVHGDALRQVDRELDQMFPNKPSTFDPQFGIRVKTAQLPEEHLVQAYVVSCSHDVEEGIDADLTLAPIKYCVDSAVCGSILVFLPGNEDILATPRWRRRHSDAGTSVRTSLPDGPRGPTANSTPSGHRKVILSTNIAEASLTIEDVVFVIDCGKTKELTYDCSNRISELNVTQIAKLNAEQRRGRAGRCRNGFCFRLYSSKDFEDMPLAQVAEMKRAAIHDICLHAKIFAPRNMTAKAFLELAPEPPSPEAIEKSLGSLEELGPLSSDSVPQPTGPLVGPRREPAPTKLGRLIARLPLDPQQARMLVFGLVLKCFSPMLTIVSTLSHRDPYQILELALGPVHKPVFTPPLYRCLTVWC
ncbi:putative ATP-dependent RNA helicase DHX36-like protein [Aphelenchoides avenae]|nr:putative ATP-dependent RNA helicase DHX36-like protein [Aphelenchus avenae]